MPTISIAMATYNGARFLGEQLDSFMAQEYLPCELVVGDDGSSDETITILEAFAVRSPFPVRIQRNLENLGFAANFLATAERCEGEWVALSDQDDVWLPNKLARVASEILERRDPDLVLVAHQVEITDQHLRPLGRRPNWHKWHGMQMLRRGTANGLWSLGGCAMICHQRLIRGIDWRERTFNENAWRNLGFPADRLVGHDRWYSLLANALGSTLLLDEALGLFRRHDEVTTGQHVTQGLAASFRVAAATGPQIYRGDERAALDAAVSLRRIATSLDKGRGTRLEEGAMDFERLAKVMARRARVQETSGRIRRLAIVISLALRRGYVGDQFASAGPRALAKDLFLSVMG